MSSTAQSPQHCIHDSDPLISNKKYHANSSYCSSAPLAPLYPACVYPRYIEQTTPPTLHLLHALRNYIGIEADQIIITHNITLGHPVPEPDIDRHEATASTKETRSEIARICRTKQNTDGTGIQIVRPLLAFFIHPGTSALSRTTSRQ